MSDLTAALTTSAPDLPLAPVSTRVLRRGVLIAKTVHYAQILVSGPPGSGKSTLVRQLGGWPEEGYIDLTMRGWWQAKTLALRPREIHFGLPFLGHKSGLSLFSETWLQDWRTLELEPRRIRIPPPKRHLLAADWRNRFAFEIVLPTAETIVGYRQERAKRGTHPIDERIDPEQIAAQLAIYAQVALRLHGQGMIVHLRARAHEPPMRIDDHGTPNRHLP